MLFKYILTDTELQIRLFNWTVRKVPYQNIEDARVGWACWAENWCNPWPWKYAVIRRKNGWIKNLHINPTDRENFISQLKQKILKK